MVSPLVHHFRLVIQLLDNMQNQANKYDKLTECLSSFRKVPAIFEQFSKDSSTDKLDQLLKTAAMMKKVGELHRGQGERQIQLFHRFYCRLREIIYAFLNYYLNSNTFIFIREFLIAVNKRILQFHPGTDPRTIQQSISQLIIDEVKKLASMRNVSLNTVQTQIQQLSIKTLPETPENQVNITMNPEDLGRPLSAKRRLYPGSSIVRGLGINIIPDLERREVQMLSFLSKDDLFRDCMNRNRFIQGQIKKYHQIYKNFKSKSPNKKRITVSSASDRIQVDDGQSPTQPSQKKTSKSYKQYSFQKKRASLYEPVEVDISDQKLKEEVLNQIYENRQKLCLKKVVVLGNDLMLQPKAGDKMRIHSSPLSRWVRPKSAHRNKPNRCNLSMSVTLRKN